MQALLPKKGRLGRFFLVTLLLGFLAFPNIGEATNRLKVPECKASPITCPNNDTIEWNTRGISSVDVEVKKSGKVICTDGNVIGGEYTCPMSASGNYSIEIGFVEGNVAKSEKCYCRGRQKSLKVKTEDRGDIQMAPKPKGTILSAPSNSRSSEEDMPVLTNHSTVEDSDTNAEFITVQSGDTLSHLALEHGTSVAQLMEVNGLTDHLIYPGQQLKIPGS